MTDLQVEINSLRAENEKLKEILWEVYDNPPETLRLHDQKLTCAWCSAEPENDHGTQCPLQDIEQALIGGSGD